MIVAENVAVGTGLAGLVAAVSLARDVREVTVPERESRTAGSPPYHLASTVTPASPVKPRLFHGDRILPDTLGCYEEP